MRSFAPSKKQFGHCPVDDGWFYDNGEQLPAGPGVSTPDTARRLMQVERVYGLDWHRFTDADWDQLTRIYASLPGWRPEATDIARWHAVHDDRDPHLAASVEPSGLHVSGALTADQWSQWDTHFRAVVLEAHLPRYECA
jgi:hypothetical protein